MRTSVHKAFICLLGFFCLSIVHPALGGDDNFNMHWSFAVDLPQAGISGTLKGRITHLEKTDFRFEGEYLNRKAAFKSGPVLLNTVFKLDDGQIRLKDLNISISRLRIKVPEYGLDNPDISINGNGLINTVSGTAELKDMELCIGNLPPINSSLKYSPSASGSVSIAIHDPLPLLEKVAESYLKGFKEWDKFGNFILKLDIAGINNAAHAALNLTFTDLAASSPDGNILLDGMSGSITAQVPLKKPDIKTTISIESGEALYKTFYIDFSAHPLEAVLEGESADAGHSVSGSLNMNWDKIGNLLVKGQRTSNPGGSQAAAVVNLLLPDMEPCFRLFAVDPLSLGNVSATGKLAANCSISHKQNGTVLNGFINLTGVGFKSEAVKISGLDSRLPFIVSLDENMHPQQDPDLQGPEQGSIETENITVGPVKINHLDFPLTVSSNEISFGHISPIKIGKGRLGLSDLSVKSPFSDNFVLHGRLAAENIDLLPLSPDSLPVEGQLGGNIEFWMLREHLSTSGSLKAHVYDGDMVVSEIFAENMFESSRQYGADFKIHDLDLEPLSKALDIGRITGRMDLELTDLIIAYDQPASFRLHAATTPGSATDRDISLKAVNSLSVIGTGSGLTGAGVGVFSQFFKEFGYADLGLECTLDNDIFKIRGLIREDGIEYIIKRPPLFGINVINSNPENLISFSDMLKRLKRVIGK